MIVSTTVPGFPDIRVRVEPYRDWEITHFGRPQDLVAAGIITAEQLPRLGGGRGGRRGPGRVDVDGSRLLVSGYYKLVDGQPQPYLSVRRVKTNKQLGHIAGAIEAVAAYKRGQARFRAEEDLRLQRAAQLLQNPKACMVLGLPQASREIDLEPSIPLEVERQVDQLLAKLRREAPR